jgi:two-component system, NtrC family, response regulator AtoC
MSRILIVEDEEGVRAFLAEALERDGHEITEAHDAHEGLARVAEGDFDLVLTDLRMPRGDGMDIVRAVRTGSPDVEVIVLTAFGAVKSAVEAMRMGAFDYLEKPVSSPADLRKLVAAALARRAALVRASEPPRPLATAALTWGAPSMRPVVEALSRVARSGATVMLMGESGTGKEVAARAVHAASPRASRPFLAINCAVLSEQLFESELFGHEKGAFTGAHATRRGRLELAEGGTFFLDEIAELKPALQAKLLRVVEERTLDRLGSARPIPIDVRLIVATHRDLRAMVAEGTFRDDLYHRLAVFPVRLPPLRERREDIGPLADTMLAQLVTGRPPPRLDDEARARLGAAPWPGNARELRNALERAVILADGPVLRAEHLWLDRDQAAPSQAEPPGTLEALEKQAIERALAASGGNRREAAGALGIGLRTLYEKLKRYEIR